MMYSLSKNVDKVGESFRTIRLNEIFGDRGTILNIQFNFNEEILG
ncbi:MAG: hypothetical protein N2249_01055 [Melioribacter sp.]|nr:hypothetical protein [Melioribacter sp.]